MFGPGGVLFLLAHEMRISWRAWQTATKRSGAGRIVLLAIIALSLGFGGFWAAKGLSLVDPVPHPLVLGIIGAVLAVLLTLMVSQALMLITEALYQRGDLDLLLASPVPPWRVLIVRMGAIALNVAAFYLILLGAVFVWLPLFGGWKWMGFVPSVLGYALLGTALGLVVARGLFQLIGPRSTRVAAQILAALIGAFFFLAGQGQNFVPMDERAALFQSIGATLARTLGDPHSLISLPARAALGEPLALTIWLGVCLGVYGLAVWWFARRFAHNAAAIAGLGARRRADTRTYDTRGGLTRSLLRKEWRLLWRDPLLLSQILLQLVYLLPLFFIFGRQLGDESFGRASIAFFSGGFVLLSAMLASSLAWLTVSAEDAPDLIAAAPVSRDAIENAKALAAGAPVAALMLLPVLGAAYISPMAALWLAIGIGMSIASSCLIAIWHQAPGSRKDFRRRARGSLGVNLGRGFVVMGWSVATGVSVAGWPLLAIIPGLIALGLLLALHESRKPV